MDDASNVIGAFSEDHAAALSEISVRQLRKWNRIGLLRPSYGADERHVPYGRVYSFRDVVSLRVLGQLRNKLRVPEAHLMDVQRELSKLSDEPWASRTLEVLKRRVVIRDPVTLEKRELISGQRVLDIPLRLVISSLRGAVAKLNERGADEIGKVKRYKFVSENQPVIAGTRISVAAIKSFADAGYSVDAIIKEYPGLKAEDVKAAIEYHGQSAAA